jgi:hypothetical protein
MSVKTYNPADVSIIFAGIPIEGIADGTFVTVARNNPSYNMSIGSDGEGVRAKSNDRGGTVTLTLMQSSVSNDALSAVSLLDEASGDGIGPLLVKDNSGRTICGAETAWIQKPADSEFAREATTREWVFETDLLDVFIGGN